MGNNMDWATGRIGKVSRHTVAKPVRISGTGLHSGNIVKLEIKPAVNGGLVFQNSKDRSIQIPVSPFYVTETLQAVRLSSKNWKVQTVEHLLAALAALGITDALLELDSNEIPILDGSAQPFIEAIETSGIVDLGINVEPITLTSAVWVVDGDKYLVALPDNKFSVTYGVDFKHPLLRGQSIHMELDSPSFMKEIGSARTFGFLKDVEEMKARGLVMGGSLENAVVLTEDGYLNDSLRFENECIRHKVLDLVGDLYLMGRPIQAHVIASRAGHALDVSLAKKIMTQVALDELAARKARKAQDARKASSR